MNFITPKDAQAMLAGGKVELIDVRDPNEWARGYAPGARLLALPELRINPATTINKPKDAPVMFVCHRGSRSQAAERKAG